MRRRRKKRSGIIMAIILLALVAVVAAASLRGPDSGETPLPPPAMPQEMPEQSSPPVVEQNTHREPERDVFLHGYLGVHGERIAIFQGNPPNGILQYVTEFEVRDDVRDQLEKGVPFSTTQELMQLLESYTS
ncbi:MAG: BofC C-terminal domain-containing protein [Clostridiales bacterium]|nr:BofC C-terminal domain-containing protein [Clostridiales bacterium]